MVSDFGEGITSQEQTISGERKNPRHDPATTGGTVLGSVHPPAYGRGLLVSIVAAAIVFALAIFASGGKEEFTGIPMTQTTGSAFLGPDDPRDHPGGSRLAIRRGRCDPGSGIARPGTGAQDRLPTAWAVPAASVATALLLVATYHNRVMLVAGPAIAFLGVAGGLFARDLLEDTMEGAERTAALIHTVVIHAIAFLGLSAVYMNKMSGWYGGPIVFLLTAVLMFEHLERAKLPDGLRLLYSSLAAGLMTLALLAVNWWPTYGWTGGAALLLCFFVLAGFASARGERQSLRDRDLIEYGAVFVGGLLILAITL